MMILRVFSKKKDLILFDEPSAQLEVLTELICYDESDVLEEFLMFNVYVNVDENKMKI